MSWEILRRCWESRHAASRNYAHLVEFTKWRFNCISRDGRVAIGKEVTSKWLQTIGHSGST